MYRIVLHLTCMSGTILCMEDTMRVAQSTGRQDLRYAKERRPTVSIRFNQSFLDRIDRAASEKGMTRTRLIEESIRLFLAVDTSLTHTNGHPPDPQP